MMAVYPEPSVSDREAVERLIRGAHASERAPAIYAEYGELRVELHVVEPDRLLWHCRVWDEQLSTCRLLPLLADVKYVRQVILYHLGKRLEMGRIN